MFLVAPRAQKKIVFGYLGPFNRAFKVATDLTPSEFRRLAMARNASMLPKTNAVAGIGKPD